MQVGLHAIEFSLPAIPGREIKSTLGRRAVKKEARVKIRRAGKRACREHY